MTAKDISENLLTADYRGKKFKLTCLLQILEDPQVRAELRILLNSNSIVTPESSLKEMKALDLIHLRDNLSDELKKNSQLIDDVYAELNSRCCNHDAIERNPEFLKPL